MDPWEYKGHFKRPRFVQCGQRSETQRSWGSTKGVCSGITSRKTAQVLISPSESVCCSADIYCCADRELWLCKPSQYFCTAFDVPCRHIKLFKDLCLLPYLFYWWPAVWKLWSPFLASGLTWSPKPDYCTCRSSELNWLVGGKHLWQLLMHSRLVFYLRVFLIYYHLARFPRVLEILYLKWNSYDDVFP